MVKRLAGILRFHIQWMKNNSYIIGVYSKDLELNILKISSFFTLKQSLLKIHFYVLVG